MFIADPLVIRVLDELPCIAKLSPPYGRVPNDYKADPSMKLVGALWQILLCAANGRRASAKIASCDEPHYEPRQL